jgi:hypothetical protein
MGSPPIRRLSAAALTLLALAAAFAGSASARPATADEARATALTFLNALGNDQAEKVCGMFTPQALARLGGTEKCISSFTQNDSNDPDFAAVQTLARALTAARRSAAKRHGQYVTKSFTRSQLARAIERLDPELTVRLGRGPTAASGQLVTTAILDTRTTARRIVLYAESDDGSIMRLTASKHGDPSLDEAAFGIPEAPPATPEPPDFTATIATVTIDAMGTASVWGTYTVTYDGDTISVEVLLVLVPTAAGYRVDDFLYSILSPSP